MKKMIAIIAVLLGLAVMLTACGNYQVIDVQYTFNRALVKLQDGTIVSGRVERWKDYEDGDQIQVRIDGVTYLVHAANCTLMAD